jgi:hypothetical protein
MGESRYKEVMGKQVGATVGPSNYHRPAGKGQVPIASSVKDAEDEADEDHCFPASGRDISLRAITYVACLLQANLSLLVLEFFNWHRPSKGKL